MRAYYTHNLMSRHSVTISRVYRARQKVSSNEFYLFFKNYKEVGLQQQNGMVWYTRV